MKGWTSVLVGMLLLGCGHTKPPASVDELSALADNSVSSELENAAPSAWAEARRYLSMAKEATDEGDPAQADRFARLGALYAKIARARAEQAATRKKVAEAEKQKQLLREEISAVSHTLRDLEAKMERERMRRHLLEVVEKTRRVAAAEEELRERLLPPSERNVLGEARKRIGDELLARAQVWEDLVRSLVNRNAVDEGELALVEGPLALARKQQEMNDLAGVQQYSEESGIEARRIVEQVWEWSGQQPERALAGVVEKIEAAGFEIERGELGPAVLIEVTKPKSKKGGDRWHERLGGLGSVIAAFEGVACILLVNDRGTAQGTVDISSLAMKTLRESGISDDRLQLRNVGSASPVVALRREGSRLAVVLVPVPEKR